MADDLGYSTPPDMFIAAQYSSFSEDEHAESSSNDSSSPNEDSYSNGDVSGEVSPPDDVKDFQSVEVPVATPSKSASRSKNSKKSSKSGSKTKTSKAIKTSKAADEAKLLDELIAANKSMAGRNVQAQPQVPTKTNKTKTSLKNKLRERMAMKKDPFAKFVNRETGEAELPMKKTPEKVDPLPVTKYQQALVRGLFPNFARHIDERAINFDNKKLEQSEDEKLKTNQTIDALLKHYEPRIASGELGVDEVIQKVFAVDNDSDDEPEVIEMKAVTKNYYTELTMDAIEYSMSTTNHIDDMISLRDFEKGLPFNELNISGWKTMCNTVHRGLRHRNPGITSPEHFYEEILKKYTSQMFLNAVKSMDACDLFEKYKPHEQPMVILSFQKHMSDIFPSLDGVLPFNQMTERGLLPAKSATFNPFDGKLLAYGLFWSFSINFNLFGAFFKADSGGYGYYWVTYNRLEENIQDIIDPVMKKYQEKFDMRNTTVEMDMSGNIIKTSHI